MGEPASTVLRQLVMLRQQAGLSQAALARRIGTQQSAISEMESGEVEMKRRECQCGESLSWWWSLTGGYWCTWCVRRMQMGGTPRPKKEQK